MNVVHDIDELPAGLRFVMAIGTFDGVHRGHTRVVGALTRAARKFESVPVVLTFDPHPAQVLRGGAPLLLCDMDERLELLEHLGVAITVIQPFTREFADQSAEQFISRLTNRRDLVALVLTAESAFGRDREAGLPAVRRLAVEHGYQVIEVDRLANRGQIVSSTVLRKAVADGRLSVARRLLGRRYAVTGTVVEGDRRGRTLGYPTANLSFADDVALPPDGVYAVRVRWADERDVIQHRLGVASLGVRPTFAVGGARLLEVNVFDFNGDLYGRRMRVEFVRRLRGEKRFASARALITQMDRDAARARRLLEALP